MTDVHMLKPHRHAHTPTEQPQSEVSQGAAEAAVVASLMAFIRNSACLSQADRLSLSTSVCCGCFVLNVTNSPNICHDCVNLDGTALMCSSADLTTFMFFGFLYSASVGGSSHWSYSSCACSLTPAENLECVPTLASRLLVFSLM